MQTRDCTGTRVTLPWGAAQVERAVTVSGTAAGERQIEVGIALLRSTAEDEERMLRFFYRSAGRTARGPLTLRQAEIEALAARLRHEPELRAALSGLLG